MFGRVALRRMDGSTSARPEYLSVRSRSTVDPLVAVREDPVETDAESDKMGGFQLIEEEHRPSCLFAGQAWSENGW